MPGLKSLIRNLGVRCRYCLVVGLLAIVSLPRFSQAEIPDRLYYPRPEADFDERTGYPLALLRLALANHVDTQHVELLPTEMRMPRGRSLRLLQRGVAVDIFWSISSKQREQDLLAVKFPLYQGLFGYRLLLINSNASAKFAKIDSAPGLQAMVAGLAHDWPDYKILSKNGYQVQGSSSYSGLFKMLQRGRVDYLPRSVFEIKAEFEHFENQGISIEPRLALHYPVNFYFFVSKNNKELARKLSESLTSLQEQGKTRILFEAVHEQILKDAKLGQRTVFELQN